MNKLISLFDGSNYYEYHGHQDEEVRWPIWLGLGPPLIAGAATLYLIGRAVMAWAGA